MSRNNTRTKTQKPHTLDVAHSNMGYKILNSDHIVGRPSGTGRIVYVDLRNPHARFSPRTTLSQPRHK